MNPDTTNTIFQKAVSFVTHTNKNLFVTGKAGTGKTTFLKYIREKGFRKMAVVAPTGVAAINAGGVTIHSFFQIPPCTFIPSNIISGNFSGEVHNATSLIRNLKLNSDKLNVIRELEVLVIDEVSMVRADLLDAIDAVLRHVRHKHAVPFGGVQMIFIGDLFQLPPVTRNNEWEELKRYYSSPFFFDAHALKDNAPLYLELKKIYRQKDDAFISLLNNVRNNCCSENDLELLHQYYKPGFTPPEGEHYITLSSHNEKADKINQRELEKLPGKLYSFEAVIEGAFYENSYPADKTLFLKAGAQIMFIKNDTGEERKYFNGKIGIIKSISSEKIVITFPNEEADLDLSYETWENIKYNYNDQTDKLEQNKQGSFKQYPIRLAWAITIHKSQGLTFDRAIIDAGASFAAGQVYVSLSRLTSIQGLVLYSKIWPGCISTDTRVIEFTKKDISEDELQQTLEAEQINFIRYSLLENFDFRKIIDELNEHLESYEYRQIEKKADAVAWCKRLLITAGELKDVGNKFMRQLEQIIRQGEAADQEILFQRISLGVSYFRKEIEDKCIAAVEEHLESIKGQQRVKNYANSVIELLKVFKKQQVNFDQTIRLANALKSKMPLPGLLSLLEELRKPVYILTEKPIRKSKKPEKGDSMRESLKMFKAGKSIKEIAHERYIATTTVFSHLASFIPTGEVIITDILTQEKLDKILEQIEKAPTEGAGFHKQQLNDEYDYSEIKAAWDYRNKMLEIASQ